MNTIIQVNNSSIYQIGNQVYFAIRDKNGELLQSENLTSKLKELDLNLNYSHEKRNIT